MSEADVVRRLDRLISVFELAHRDELREAREAIRSDETNVAILEHAAEQVAAKALSEVVRKKTGQSPKTVQRRIADLVAIGALERIGSGNNIAYRSTGLV